MAHFAQLDENNTVITIVVVSNGVLDDLEFPASEALGQQFLKDHYGSETLWLQTSYNKKFRGNFATPGFTYYPDADLFMPPKSQASWIINSSLAVWEPPIPKPDCKRYRWNEETVSWDYVPPSPQPFTSWTLNECDQWQAPIARPTDPAGAGSFWAWDEANQSWKSVPMPLPPAPGELPPAPAEPLPPGKIYAWHLSQKQWIIMDQRSDQ